MKKRLGVAIITAVVLLTAGLAAAASPPNLVGTWEGTGNSVGWGSSNWIYQGFKYDVVGPTFTIQDQDPVTGNFYGNLGEYYTGYVVVFFFTGNVSTNKTVTIVGGDSIITGKVSGNKFSGTMVRFVSDQIETQTFTVYKQ
jgi:hypothetical protein